MENKFKIINATCIFMTYGLVLAMMALSTSQYKKNISGHSLGEYGILLVGIVVWYMVHIFIHELGHLLFGIMSGYEFVSFRVGQIILVNEKGNLKVKQMKLSGTVGQCLMRPPQSRGELYPYILYLLGGGILNGIVSVGSLFTYCKLENNGFTFLVFYLFGIVGMCMAILNCIPMNLGEIINDGYNILMLKSELEGRKAHYYVLVLNAMLTNSISYSDIPRDLVNDVLSCEFDNVSNPCIANIILYKAQLLVANREYKSAKECYRKLVFAKNVVGVIRNEAKCELLFWSIFDGESSKVIDEIYSKKLRRYIVETNSYPARKRIMYAYYLLYKKDFENARKQLQDFEKMRKKYPIKGEIEFENQMIKMIDRRNESI